jgi:hypothetical protein
VALEHREQLGDRPDPDPLGHVQSFSDPPFFMIVAYDWTIWPSPALST